MMLTVDTNKNVQVLQVTTTYTSSQIQQKNVILKIIYEAINTEHFTIPRKLVVVVLQLSFPVSLKKLIFWENATKMLK